MGTTQERFCPPSSGNDLSPAWNQSRLESVSFALHPMLKHLQRHGAVVI
jgi:hypothetical protein